MESRSQSGKYQLLMWISLMVFLSVCVYFIIHNAHWLLGDEAIVFSHTGMGKAFSLLGFEGMISTYGRMYPFAYSLYNILLLFYDGYVSATAVYTLQGVALVVFAVFFVFLAIHILRDVSSPWKYASIFFFAVICVFRVYTEFITCYTGVWIVFLFLPIFLFFSCRFMDSEKWVDGLIAFLSINYIIYCYETVFVIPTTIGICELLFHYRELTHRRRAFCIMLLGSGVLFLAIYACIVLPNANGFYHHYGTTSFINNAIRMFIANKIYWLSALVLIARLIEVLLKKKPYSFFDSLLLSSFAYFLGAAVLKLDLTYYYNLGALVGLTASLYFLKDWMKPGWLCMVFVAFAFFYGRRIPSVIGKFQTERVDVYNQMSFLSEQLNGQEEVLYWYEPTIEGMSLAYLDFRESAKLSVEAYLSWIQHCEITIQRKTSFDSSEGIWLVYTGKEADLSITPDELTLCQTVFSTSFILGYKYE